MQNAELDHAASHLGKAVGISTLLRGTVYHAQRRRIYLPADLMAQEGVDENQLTKGEASEGLNNVVFEVASAAKVSVCTGYSKPCPNLDTTFLENTCRAWSTFCTWLAIHPASVIGCVVLNCAYATGPHGVHPKCQLSSGLLCVLLQGHLDESRSFTGKLPKQAKPLMLPAIACGLFLDTLQKANFDVFSQAMLKPAFSPLWHQLQVKRHYLLGSY